MALRLLFLGDVVGPAGRRAVESQLARIRRELEVGFCIVNAENTADGRGLTPKLAHRLREAGADVLTLGNHTFARRELADWLADAERIVRPGNFSRHAPGRALVVAPAADGTPVAVLQLQGSLFLDVAHSAWELVDELVDEARAAARVVVLDFHAEATSEKVAMARWLDGRVTAVIGTHTHVQTADGRVQPGGTAAITDAGMTGPHDSVIGVEAELAIRRMRTGMPVRFETAVGDVRIEGVLIECDPATGNALRCEAVRIPVP